MIGSSKKAFSFVEVLVAVVLLFIALMALLKFDAFVKSDIEKSIERQKVLMISSGINHSDEEGKIKLEQMFKFVKLREDEKRFLKDIEIEAKVLDEDNHLIYSDSNNLYEIDSQKIRYEYDKNSAVFYRLIEK